MFPWLRLPLRLRKSHSNRNRRPRSWLTLEALEDRVAPTVELISVGDPPGTPANNSSVTADSGSPNARTMSEDGRYVVFLSDATNLVPGQTDANGDQDVFLRDRQTGQTTLISHTGDDTTTGNGGSTFAQISDDGSVVVFQSKATNLIPGYTGNSSSIIYRWSADQVTLVSHAVDSTTAGANGGSVQPVLSGDGSTIAFASNATNLVADYTGSGQQIYRWQGGTLNLVSGMDSSATQGSNGPSSFPSISQDGGVVAFTSEATDLVSDFVDGNSFFPDFYRWSAGTVGLISGAGGSATQGADDGGYNVVVSSGGSTVVYDSAATDLVAGDTNNDDDLFLFEVPPSAAYTWDDAANTLVIHLDTDQSLTVSESGGVVSFAVDTGTLARSGGDAAGGDGTGNITFNAADLVASVLVDNGGVGAGTNDVTFDGAGALSSAAVAVSITDADAVGTITFSNGFDLAATTGGIALTTVRNIRVSSGSTLSTTDGDLTLSANEQQTPTNGEFNGISQFGTLSTSGAGDIRLESVGGDTNSSRGISFGSARIESTSMADGAGRITLRGTSRSPNQSSIGVEAVGGTITSVLGAIEITGQGGTGDGAGKHGVLLGFAFAISSTGTGPGAATITIDGTGGSGGTGTTNHGIRLGGGAASQVTSVDGAILIRGSAGTGTSVGIDVGSSGAGHQISATGAAPVTLVADTINVGTVGTIGAGANTVTLKPRTTDGSIGIDLGGADSATALGLTDAELDRITAGTLVFGSNEIGDVRVTGAITRAAATAVELHAGQAIVFDGGSLDTANGNLLLDPNEPGVQPRTAGFDIALANTVSFASDLAIRIGGTTVDTEYDQLNANALVDLTGVNLVLEGTYVPNPGESIVVVMSEGITGTFNDLPEGAVFGFNGRVLRISYLGRAGGDATLTALATPATNLVVDNTGDVSDGNFGTNQLTLREAIELANALPDANTITFDATLFGTPQTITLNGTQLPTLTEDVTITSPGAKLLTIDANQQSRHFFITSGVTAVFSGLTLTNGRALAASISSFGDLTLHSVAVTGNTDPDSVNSDVGGIRVGGGALTVVNSTIANNVGSGIVAFNARVVVRNSTISGNQSAGLGSAITALFASASLSLENSTVTGNRSGSGNAVAFFFAGGPVVLTNSIVAGNTITSNGTPADLGGSSALVSGSFNLIGDPNSAGGLTHGTNGNIVGDGMGGVIDINAVLNATLADNGGATPTHALVTGSPAIDAGGPAGPATTDQRGSPRPSDMPGVANAADGRDIGAFEALAPAPMVGLSPDPLNPTLMALVVQGDADANSISIRGKSGGRVEVLIDGESVGTFQPTSRILVEGGGGDDTIRVSGTNLPAWVYGGPGNDTLTTGGGKDVLVGGEGDDTLKGGKGRDVLIGGTGRDTLKGPEGRDILVAGFTLYDNQTMVSEQALAAIAAWTGGGSFQERVGQLRDAGVGGGNSVKLNATTAGDDGVSDELRGGVSDAQDVQDWFLADRDDQAPDTLLGVRSVDVVTDIDVLEG